MTAGQRNTYEALHDHVHRYGLDAALFAMREVIRDSRDSETLSAAKTRTEAATAREHYEDAMWHIERARAHIARIKGAGDAGEPVSNADYR